MNEYWSMILQFIFATIRNWLGWFLGGYDGLLFTLIVFVGINYITEVMCAIVDKNLSSLKSSSTYL